MMTEDIVFVTMLDNIYEVALKMKNHNIGFIPVLEGTRLLGIVTDRDLVIRGYAEKNSGSAPVEDVMTKEVITVGPDTSVEEAAELMAEHQIRRLPVVDNGQLIGIVALGDLAIRSHSDEKAGRALSSISENAHAPVSIH